jgi:hypothetical protein
MQNISHSSARTFDRILKLAELAEANPAALSLYGAEVGRGDLAQLRAILRIDPFAPGIPELVEKIFTDFSFCVSVTRTGKDWRQ